MCCVLSHFSCIQLFATLWTVTLAPLFMGFFRQEYWSRLLSPPPGDLPDPGIEPASFMSSALAGRLLSASATWEVWNISLWTTREAPKVLIWGRKPCRIFTPQNHFHPFHLWVPYKVITSLHIEFLCLFIYAIYSPIYYSHHTIIQLYLC